MNKKELLAELNIKPISIKQKGACSILETNDQKYVIKKQSRKADYFDYLLTRNFNNFPKVYTKCTDQIELVDYIDEKETPIEQKLEDIVYLDSILHTKTTFYKTLDIDKIKEIYESIIDKQNYILKYYQDLQDMIEQEIYMSPANYLLIRNITLVYIAIKISREKIDSWYNSIQKEKKVRYAFIHGALKEDHILESDNLYLISWDKSRIGFPIYDIENLYRNSYKNISLSEILSIYELKYPLTKEEHDLLFAILLIPNKIDLTKKEYIKVKEISNIIYYLDKTLTFLKNDSKKTNDNTNHQQEY